MHAKALAAVESDSRTIAHVMNFMQPDIGLAGIQLGPLLTATIKCSNCRGYTIVRTRVWTIASPQLRFNALLT